MSGRRAIALALILVACGEESAAEPASEVRSPRRHAAARGHRSENLPPPQPDALARSARGVHEAGEVLTGPLTLDLRGGARVELLFGARAMLLDETPAQLVLSEGALHAVLAPMGNSTRPPLRIGAPQGTLFVGGSVDAWAMVNPSGATWFALTSGRAECTTGEGEAVEVHAGQSIVAGARGVGAGPTNESAARTMLSALVEDGEVVGDEGATRGRVEPAAEALEALWTDSLALRDAHRRAEGPAKRAALRALAANGQQSEGARRALLVRYERAVAWAMRNEATSLTPLRTRVRRALRLDDDE